MRPDGGIGFWASSFLGTRNKHRLVRGCGWRRAWAVGPQSCCEGAEGIGVSLDGVELRARALASGGVTGCRAGADSPVAWPPGAWRGASPASFGLSRRARFP